MYHLKVVSAFFSVTLIFLLSGCSDSLIDSSDSEVTVEGRLLYDNLNPVQGKFIKIGEEYSQTNSDGKFLFHKVSLPYDIVILDSAHSYLYKDVSLKNPRITIHTPNQNIFPTATINVNLPPSNLYSGKVIFTNYNDINRYENLSIMGGSLRFNVTDENGIFGNVIVLLYETDVNGNIIDYKNFGKKTLIVKPRLAYDVDFTFQDLDYKPETAIISGNVQFSLYNPFYFISFSNIRSNQSIYETRFDVQSDNFSFVVPKKLPVKFYNVIGANHPFGPPIFNKVNNFPSNYLITAPERPTLIFPENNSTNIDKNSIFGFNGGGGMGVFEINFYNQHKNYTVVTNNTEFEFNDMAKMEYDYSPTHSTTWSVHKYGKYYSINDYLTFPGLDYFHVYTFASSFTSSGN